MGRWQVDLHDTDATPLGGPPYPVAMAWGFVPHPDIMSPILEFVLVPDHFRRQGYATWRVAACRERWPGLEMTEAISEAGGRAAGEIEGARGRCWRASTQPSSDSSP